MSISLQLKRLQQKIRTAFNEGMSAHGVPVAQSELLYQLLQYDGQTHQQLAKQLGVSSPTVTILVDELVKKGLVTRQVDQRDGRIKRVFLTDAARAIEAAGKTIKQAIDTKLLAGFSVDERRQLEAYLDRLQDNISTQP